MAITRVEVTPKQGPGMRDVRGDVVRRQLASDHSISVPQVRSIVGYLIKSEIDSDSIASRVNDLFADPIIEDGTTNSLMLASATHFATAPDAIVTVGFKAGVTDNPGAVTPVRNEIRVYLQVLKHFIGRLMIFEVPHNAF